MLPCLSMNTPLHCLLLQTPGELLEGEEDFLRLGYAVEAFPSMQDASCLDDAEPEELPLHTYSPGWRHGDLPELRSRHASLALMLAAARWQKEDFLIFGGSDTVPLVEATTLRDALEKELNAHPEAHLLRLFHHKAHSPNDPRKVVASLHFPLFSPAGNRARPSSTSPACIPSSFLPFTGRKWRMSSAMRRCLRTAPWNWPPPGGRSTSGLWKATSFTRNPGHNGHKLSAWSGVIWKTWIAISPISWPALRKLPCLGRRQGNNGG